MLKDQIHDDMITALKAGEKLKVQVLRYVISEIKYAEIAKQQDLTDEETVVVMQKEVKKRKEAIELFRKNNRLEVVADEEKQLEVIEKYLPKSLTSAELEGMVLDAIKMAGTDPKLGQIMGIVMGKTKGRADGKIISEIVRQKLSVSA
jgi:uncharacterized protein YqeY